MTQELKEAIRTIAKYDGHEIHEEDGSRYWWDDGEHYGWARVEDLQYHTSADALLPVWRKVRNAIAELMGDVANDHLDFPLEESAQLILDGDYPAACLKLAEIINQLNQQK